MDAKRTEVWGYTEVLNNGIQKLYGKSSFAEARRGKAGADGFTTDFADGTDGAKGKAGFEQVVPEETEIR